MSTEPMSAGELDKLTLESLPDDLIMKISVGEAKRLLAAARAGQPDAEGWRTIESAPKTPDGFALLAITDGDHPEVGCWDAGKWRNTRLEELYPQPAFWYPLPPLPTPPVQTQGGEG